MIYILLFLAAVPGFLFLVRLAIYARVYWRYSRGYDIRDFCASAHYRSITDPDQKRQALSEFCRQQTERFWST